MAEGLVLPGGMQVGAPSTEQMLQLILENVAMTRIFTELQFRCKNGQSRDEALKVLGLSLRDFPKRGESRPKPDPDVLAQLSEEAAKRQAVAAREDGDLALD